jgi:uncharacterized protein
MRFEGNHTLAGTPAEIYALMMDPKVLADCIPGCQELVQESEGVYAMKMKVALAALSGDFTGQVAIENPIPGEGYTMKVEGKGRLGFMNGGGQIRFSEPKAGETFIDFAGDVQIGGTMAAVGQRLIDTTARMMIRRFFDKVGTHRRS